MDSYSYEISGVLPSPDKSREARKCVNRLGLGLLVYALLAVALITITEIVLIFALGMDGFASLSENMYFVWGMQVLSMYVIALPVFYFIIRKLPRSSALKSKLSLGEFVGLFLVADATMTVGSMISTYITTFLSSLVGHEISDATSDLIMDTPMWIVILVAVVIGPIVEELIFRECLISRLSVYGDRYAIVVSAVAFGIFHGNLSQLVYSTGLGLILGYVYTKTRNVKYSILIHMLMNFLGTVPTLSVMESMERLEGITEEAMPEGEALLEYFSDSIKVMDVALLQYALLFAGIFMLVMAIKHKTIKIPNSKEVIIESGKLTRVTFLNVGAILFMVYCAVEIVLSIIAI